MVVNIPDGLHKKAKKFAKVNGMSLITLVTMAISEYLNKRGEAI